MNKAMPIIDAAGKYVYVENTRTIETSNHPVYQARIEVALGLGEWIGAPREGHKLASFKRAKQSQHKIEEFRKSLEFYLDSYSPDVIDTLVAQGGVTMDLEIRGDILAAVGVGIESQSALITGAGDYLVQESGGKILV